MDISKKEIIEDSATYTDNFGNIHNIDNDIAQAEEYISKLKANVNFRWEAAEISRAKRIASAKGMRYQTYIKSTLKQAMDRDERKLAMNE